MAEPQNVLENLTPEQIAALQAQLNQQNAAQELGATEVASAPQEAADSYTVTATEANYTNHEPMVWYPGTIVSVETDDGQYGEQFKFAIDTGVLDNEGNPRYDLLWTSKTFTPGSKLGKMAKAMFGAHVLEPGSTFNVRQFQGLAVEVMFEHYEATDSEGRSVMRERILNTNSGVGMRPRTGQVTATAKQVQVGPRPVEGAKPVTSDTIPADAPVAPDPDDEMPF